MVLYQDQRTLKKLVSWVRDQQRTSPNLELDMLEALKYEDQDRGFKEEAETDRRLRTEASEQHSDL